MPTAKPATTKAATHVAAAESVAATAKAPTVAATAKAPTVTATTTSTTTTACERVGLNRGHPQSDDRKDDTHLAQHDVLHHGQSVRSLVLPAHRARPHRPGQEMM